MSAVSTLVNIAKWKNFLFRNYNLPSSVYSDYPGNCKQKVWEVVMASSAAPAFYREKTLEEYIFRVSTTATEILKSKSVRSTDDVIDITRAYV